MNSYKNAMDKIVLSDEEKEKIIKNALLKTKARKRPVLNRSNVPALLAKSRTGDRLHPTQGASATQGFGGRLQLSPKFRIGTRSPRGEGHLRLNFKYAANIAAGVIICLISIPATEFLLKPAPDYIPAITLTPSPTETPSVLPPLAHGAAFVEANNAVKSERKTETPSKNNTAHKVSEAKPSPEENTAVLQTVSTIASKQTSDTLEAGAASGADAEVLPNETENYFTEAKTTRSLSLSDSEATAFDSEYPSLPGYEISKIEYLSDTVTQIVYTNGYSQLIYRAQTGAEACDDDYNYENTVESIINDKRVTVSTDKNLGTFAAWENDETSFSLQSDTALTPEEVSELISNM